MNKQDVDHITGKIIGAAIRIHSTLGPGLLESAYRACVVKELEGCGLNVQSEVQLPIVYNGLRIDAGYRLDVVVQNTVVIEIKAIASVLPVHKAQLLSYLTLGAYPVGLLINFHVLRLKHGITRMVNNLK